MNRELTNLTLLNCITEGYGEKMKSVPTGSMHLCVYVCREAVSFTSLTVDSEF